MIHFRRISGSWQAIVLLVCLVGSAAGFAQKRNTGHLTGHAISGGKSKVTQSPPKEESNPPDAVANNAPPKPDPLGRSTPYGCVIGFLQAVNDDNLGLATQYLDTTLPEEQARELAKELKAVLDASLSSNINKLSKEEQGNVRDNLRPSRDRIGVAKTPSGDLDIFLDRIQRPQEPPVWLFASETLAKIPGAYAHLHTFDLSDRLPQPLLRIQFLGLPLWRWIAILLALVLAFLLSSLVARVLLWIFRAFLIKGNIRNEDEILHKLRTPVRILLLSLAVVTAESFSLSVLARHYWGAAAKFFGVVGFAWLIVSIIDLAANAGMRRSVATGVQQKIAVITLIQRLTKILIAFVVLLIFLRDAGINVSAMLAGLGIGGVALALAAQNTLQDLFGGISIIMRDTIRVGDYCRIADQTGTIEDIGLSSTRLRTLDRSVVSIPNSKIAQVSSENFTLRDKFWFHHVLSLRPDTSQAQINRILADIQSILDEDLNVEAGSGRVDLIGFREASFQVEIFAYVKADTYASFLKHQKELLQIVRAAISQAGAQLAMTSQTTYLENANLLHLETKKPT